MDAAYTISDHFDGHRFHNPGKSPRRGLAQVIRWQLDNNRVRWPGQVTDPTYPPPPASVAPGEVAVTFIGHASFLIRLAGLTLVTDPIFSDRCSPVSWAGPRRVRPPGLSLDQLPPIDFILVSHNHYDHLDLPTLRALRAKRATRVLTLLGNAPVLAHAGFDNALELDWWDSAVTGGFRITATPARHFSGRGVTDRGRALWGGFMIDTGAGRLLFAGDSGTGSHWRAIGERLGPPDVALLPIGACEPRWLMAPVHMNPEEAVRAHLDMKSKHSIGMHFGTFQLTDEAIDAPTKDLSSACAKLGVTDFDVLGFGQTRIIRLGQAES
jgi:L-ascorbate metabolism protein UlaG (beta-lactamase superfamily)